MASCDINALLADARELSSYPPQTIDALQTILLYRIALDGGASIPGTCAQLIAAANAAYPQIDPGELDSLLVRQLVGLQTGVVPPATAYDSVGIELLQVAKANVLCQIYNGDTITDVRPWVTMPGYLAQYNSTFVLQEIITVLLLRIANAGGGPYTFAGLLETDVCFQCACDPIVLKRLQVYIADQIQTGGCVPPAQPTSVSFIGEELLFDVSWSCAADPATDFLVEWGTVPGPPFANSQSVAPNLRALNDVVASDGDYFGRVTARNTALCTTVGTPDNDPFTVTSTPFSPDDIAGLMFWLDASDSGTLSLTGSTVDSWTDKVQSIVMTNGGVYTSPTFDALDPFNHPVVEFASASSQGLVSALNDNINAPPPYTVFFAGRITSVDAAFRSALGIWDHDTPALIHLLYFGASSANNVTEFDSGPAANTRTDDAVYSDDTPFVVTCSVQAASVQNFWINGVAVGLQSSATPTEGWNNANPQVIVGVEAGDGSGSNFFEGGMYEILVYNSELSTSDREAVETYLIGRWN